MIITREPSHEEADAYRKNIERELRNARPPTEEQLNKQLLSRGDTLLKQIEGYNDDIAASVAREASAPRCPVCNAKCKEGQAVHFDKVTGEKHIVNVERAIQ